VYPVHEDIVDIILENRGFVDCLRSLSTVLANKYAKAAGLQGCKEDVQERILA
jgi:hypothetical protein